MTDSFAPRRFIAIMRSTTNKHTMSFQCSHGVGRKLKIASAPLAIEIEIVRT